jgi:hypothetical protein
MFIEILKLSGVTAQLAYERSSSGHREVYDGSALGDDVGADRSNVGRRANRLKAFRAGAVAAARQRISADAADACL